MYKRCTLFLLGFHLLTCSLVAQGYQTNAVNWGLPAGGYLDVGVTFGYNALAGLAQDLHDTNSESWGLQDMDGDGRPDLVVTGQRNSNGYVQEFSPGSNSFWKVYSNTGSGFSTSAVNWSLPTGGYLDGGVTFGYNALAGLAQDLHDTNSESWGLQDMDGDGRPDLVVTGQRNSNGYVQEFSPGSSSFWKVYSNTGSGFSTTAVSWGLPAGGYLDVGVTFGYNALAGLAQDFHDTNSESWGLHDVDGDGRPDLVVTGQRNSNGYVQEFSPGSSSFWKVYSNTGSGFSTSAVNWSLPTGGYLDGGITFGYNALAGLAQDLHDTNSESWGLQDMDGDGRPDLVVTGQRNSNGYVQEFSPGSNSFWKVYSNTGTGFSTTAVSWSLPAGGYLDVGVTFGYNALAGLAQDFHDTNSESWGLQDMDGDGRPDLVVTGQRNSNGYVQEFSPGSNSFWKVYSNTGTGFSTNAVNWGLPAGGYLDVGVTFGYNALAGLAQDLHDTNSESWGLQDMDGDGRPDLVVTGQRNSNGYVQEFSPGSNSFWKVYFVEGSVGVPEEERTRTHLFPNPATDHIILEHDEGQSVVLITDVAGRLVRSLTVQGGRSIIHVGDLPDGIYSVNVVPEGSRQGHRFVISR